MTRVTCGMIAVAIVAASASASAQSTPGSQTRDPWEVFAQVAFGVDTNDITSQSCDTAKSDFPAPVTTQCSGDGGAGALSLEGGVSWNFGSRFGVDVVGGWHKAGTTSFSHSATLTPQEVLRAAEINYNAWQLKIGPKVTFGNSNFSADLAAYYGLSHFFAHANVEDQRLLNGVITGGSEAVIESNASRHAAFAIAVYMSIGKNSLFRPYFEYMALSFENVMNGNTNNQAGAPDQFSAHTFVGGVRVPVANLFRD